MVHDAGGPRAAFMYPRVQVFEVNIVGLHSRMQRTSPIFDPRSATPEAFRQAFHRTGRNRTARAANRGPRHAGLWCFSCAWCFCQAISVQCPFPSPASSTNFSNRVLGIEQRGRNVVRGFEVARLASYRLGLVGSPLSLGAQAGQGA